MSLNGPNNLRLTCETSRTHQSFKKDCDINEIWRRYVKTGVLEAGRGGEPKYGDFDNDPGLQECLNRVLSAERRFDALSSDIRDQVDNDPVQLIEFLADPANQKRAIELGLAVAPPVSNEPIEDPPTPAQPPAGDPPAPPQPPPSGENS